MADRAQVQVVDPLTVVVIDTDVAYPGLLMAATNYRPAVADVVTVILLSGGYALVLGPWSQ